MLSSRRYLRYTMRYLHDYKYKYVKKMREDCLRLCDKNTKRYYISSRRIQTSCRLSSSIETELENKENSERDDNPFGINDELRKKLIYCEYLDGNKLKAGYRKSKISEEIRKTNERRENFNKQMETPVYSIALENMLKRNKIKLPKDETIPETISQIQKPVHMPYSGTNKYETIEIGETDIDQSDPSIENENIKPSGLNEEYKILYEQYLETAAAKSVNLTERYEALTETIESKFNSELADNMSKVPSDWMTDYEQFDDSTIGENWELNYGTAEPNSEVSATPCGGCGALLHCKDPSIPGYLPSELFSGKKKDDLNSMPCQRCHFMKNYNTSLAVNVSSDEYPKLLASIKNKRAAVILLVDLMDFPCSIWPDILSIIGTKRPVFVVGNKVDLLPQDSNNFFKHVTECLSKAITDTGINQANVKHIALISAKTGFGVEELINKLHNIWKYQGHVYLIGCTNSGKSTLFNALLQSDYCKSQAVDVIQRATTSPWPGTTLNLLKFPILRPSDWRLSQRAKRLSNDRALRHAEEKLRREKLSETKNLKYAQLIGHIGRTFGDEKPLDSEHPFAGGSRSVNQKKLGIDIEDLAYKDSHWCYDTPGTVQPDQVLNLLTTDELMLTLPRRIITPRTFSLNSRQTLFLGGLGRLDYFDGHGFIRVTVFASVELPVTICYSHEASSIYDELLSTEALAVPFNDPERLKKWPELMNKDLEVTGIDWDHSAADIVLSSAGWIAVTPGPGRKVNFKAWTPEGRGIHLRTPALLPHSVRLRGRKVRDTPGYYRGRAVYRKPN